MSNNPLGSFCSPLPKLHPRQSDVRSCSDNDAARGKKRLCGASKAPAAVSRAKELSGNNSVFPVKTFLFKGRVPGFIVVNKVVYDVCSSPLNSGKCPEFDALLVNTESKLVYGAKLSERQNLFVLYFDDVSAQ